MANIEPILFADGALRLTDHGPRGGGLVLLHVGGKQVDISYEHAWNGPIMVGMLGRHIASMVRCRYEPEVIVDDIAHRYGTAKH
jgi:hypothetical protein